MRERLKRQAYGMSEAAVTRHPIGQATATARKLQDAFEAAGFGLPTEPVLLAGSAAVAVAPIPAAFAERLAEWIAGRA